MEFTYLGRVYVCEEYDHHNIKRNGHSLLLCLLDKKRANIVASFLVMSDMLTVALWEGA